MGFFSLAINSLCCTHIDQKSNMATMAAISQFFILRNYDQAKSDRQCVFAISNLEGFDPNLLQNLQGAFPNRAYIPYEFSQ